MLLFLLITRLNEFITWIVRLSCRLSSKLSVQLLLKTKTSLTGTKSHELDLGRHSRRMCRFKNLLMSRDGSVGVLTTFNMASHGSWLFCLRTLSLSIFFDCTYCHFHRVLGNDVDSCKSLRLGQYLFKCFVLANHDNDRVLIPLR